MRSLIRHTNVPRLAIVAAAAIVLVALGCTGSFATGPKAKAAAANGWNGFGVGNWPGADWRPYSAKSPFNQRIPKKVRVHARSREYVSQMLQASLPSSIVGGVAGTSSDYAHPTYWAQPSDPLYTLQPNSSWGDPSIRGQRIRIPSGAKPALGGDGHMTIVQPDGWEYDFWRAREPSGSVLSYTAGSRIRINGSGLRAGATASDFGNLAGVIRAPELAAGKINHALFLVIRCTSSTTSYGWGARKRAGSDNDSAFVYPATGGGSTCGGNDGLPMGARLQLAISEKKIKSLHLPVWKRGVLLALKRYGAYVGDTGGPGVGVMIESSLTYTSFGRADPLVSFGQSRKGAGDRFVSANGGRVQFDIAKGVDWQSKLRVVAPPKHY